MIFAGGKATRLGGVNKALLEVGGQRIIDRILQALEPLANERIVLTNDESLASIGGLELVYDPRPHAGVLPALAAGLEAASGDLCLAVACDMPFVSRPLFQRMIDLLRAESVDVVIPRTEGFLEPMHAVYRREPVLRAIRAALERGEARMISYFTDVRVRELEEADWRDLDPAATAFLNVNTPEDLERACRLAQLPGQI